MLRETCYIGCLSPKPTRQSVGFAAGRSRVQLSNQWIMDLSIVIPVRNEAENIGPLVAEITAALDGLTPYEIVYVDDGSSDGTAAEIMRLAVDRPQLRLLRHARSCGQSAAILTGVRAARGDWVATLDGDGQTTPPTFRGLSRLARAAPADPPLLVAGHREKRRDVWSKRAASRIANGWRSRLLGDATPDTGCGLKLFPRALFLDLPAFDHIHRFLPALVLRAGGTVRSVAVNHRPRRGGARITEFSTVSGVGIVDLCGGVVAAAAHVRPQPDCRRDGRRSGRGATAAPLSARAEHERERASDRAAICRLATGSRGSSLLVLVTAGTAVAGGVDGARSAAFGAAIAGHPAAPLVFVALHLAASLLFVPRTVLAIAAGLIFGMVGAWCGPRRERARRGRRICVARYVNAGVVDPGRSACGADARPRRARRLARGRSAAAHPDHAAQPRELRARLDPPAARRLRARLAHRPVADDDRLCRFRRGRRAGPGDPGWLAPTVIGAAALGLSLLIPAVIRRRAG